MGGTQGALTVLAVGDIVDGPGDVGRCCGLLRAHGVVAVRGNHDRWLLADQARSFADAHHRRDLDAETIAYLQALPRTRRITTVRGELMLCHGVGDDDMRRLVPSSPGIEHDLDRLGDPTLRIVVGGHTHERMVRTFPRPGMPPLVFINPGTLRAPGRTHVPDCGFFFVDLAASIVVIFDLVEADDEIRVVQRGERALVW